MKRVRKPVMKMALCTVLSALAAPAAAPAQSLYLQQPPPRPPGVQGHDERDPGESLYSMSMFAVPAPKPRAFKVHNLVTIVVDESSQQSADQQTKSDKTYNVNAQLNALLDFQALLELQLKQGNLGNVNLIDAAAKQKFDGKGSYTRNDKLSMKIEAEIIDVKPNGVLVIEARKTVDKNGETQTTILSGSCRQEDITANNSVFSSQLANLTLVTKSEGSVNEAGKKGLIPRVLDSVFNF
jgi:flagellar L-ring protein precursor FlgH